MKNAKYIAGTPCPDCEHGTIIVLRITRMRDKHGWFSRVEWVCNNCHWQDEQDLRKEK